MKLFRLLTLSSLLLLNSRVVPARDVEDDIKDVLANQVDAWNRGDLNAFIEPYATDCIFVAKQVVVGRDKVLARYRKAYPSGTAMGTLGFSKLEIKELDGHVAVVIGEWHIDRTADGGGPIGGIFSLVLKNIDDEWRIVVDHTTAN